jgi:hypothetical protein
MPILFRSVAYILGDTAISNYKHANNPLWEAHVTKIGLVLSSNMQLIRHL